MPDGATTVLIVTLALAVLVGANIIRTIWHKLRIYKKNKQAWLAAKAESVSRPFVEESDAGANTKQAKPTRSSGPKRAGPKVKPTDDGRADIAECLTETNRAKNKLINAFDELLASKGASITISERNELLTAVSQLIGRLEAYGERLTKLKHVNETPPSPVVDNKQEAVQANQKQQAQA